MRSYEEPDQNACLALFEQNCPEYFDPAERADYVEFLSSRPAGYQVCVQGATLVGAFGVAERTAGGLALRWILIAPVAQGRGVGRAMMAQALDACRARGADTLHIAASQKSAPFFARFGAQAVRTIPQGWGRELDRIEMSVNIMQHQRLKPSPASECPACLNISKT